MQRTKIPWCDYTINPVKGLCPVACSYCYARRMYKRFKWNPRIEWDEQCLLDLRKIKEPSRIFVGSTMELFGDWVFGSALSIIFQYVRNYPEHIFIFLTKKPENLPLEWPDNCWVGVSVTGNGDMTLALTNLANIKATVRFLSIEPLLGQIGMDDHMSMKGIVDWVILGEQTRPTVHPHKEWCSEIINASDKASIPVFIKEPLASYLNIYRQEFPI